MLVTKKWIEAFGDYFVELVPNLFYARGLDFSAVSFVAAQDITDEYVVAIAEKLGLSKYELIAKAEDLPGFASFPTHCLSPDRTKCLIYSGLSEIGMGGPLLGEARIEFLRSQTAPIILAGTFGGPPHWASDSKKITLPKWIGSEKKEFSYKFKS